MRGKGFTLISLLLLRKRSCKGFTLIELLVTISILSVLMTIALISYQNIQRNGRDARRKSDIANIQSALEQYHADQGFYPLSITPGQALQNPGLSKTYLVKVPKEQISGTPEYSYSPLPAPPSCDNTAPARFCTNYCLYATMENGSNGTNVPNCATIAPASTYQVQAP